MAKTINDTVLDQALNYIKNNADELDVCSAQPTTYAEAHTTYMLAQHTMASGDYSVENGDSNGRKVAVAEQADISVSASGSATHIALCDVGSSALLVVTSCTSQALTSGNTVTVPTWDDEIADPS